jgi:hypothetical protein
MTADISMRYEPLSSDEVTLHLIATGVVQLCRIAGLSQPIEVPYPNDLQHGLNRLSVAALRCAAPPPQGLADLIHWCRRPLREWPLDLSIEAVSDEECLLDDDLPTGICDAWACATDDAEAQLTEQHIMLSVLSLCQSSGSPHAYVAFRRLLIEHPVLTGLEFQRYLTDPQMTLLSEYIRASYSAAPAAARNHGFYATCANCNNLLLRSSRGELVCEDENCRRSSQRMGRVGKTIAASEGVAWLIRGLRRFVAAPGRAELRLAHRLERLGLDVDLWPSFDRYDLRIVFPDGEVWAVDVKDWADPILLARRLNEKGSPAIPSEPAWTRAYFVFPDERRQERPDYVRAFQNRATILGKEIRAAFARDLLRDVKKKLAEGRQRNA